jgi:hypothetical protein
VGVAWDQHRRPRIRARPDASAAPVGAGPVRRGR